MKKHLLLLLALALTAICSSAQNKISLQGMELLEEFKQKGFIMPPTSTPGLDRNDTPSATITTMSASESESGITSIAAFVVLEPEGSAAKLEDIGLNVVTDLDEVVIVDLPLARAEEIATLPWVRQLDFGGMSAPMLNFARQQGNVDNVQTGFSYEGKTMSFDGSGVVCGMMDTGLDPNHINFKDNDGNIRIQRLWWMNSSNGTSQMYTSATIPTFTTDNQNESHATHVGGIIGGSYKGDAYFRSPTSPDGTSGGNYLTTPGSMPFYGVATGADLAFAAGSLYDPNIINGVDNIIKYAQSVGKPVVVNLSLGRTTGPHDGTDAYSKALSALGQKGIICMSAGNDGEDPISLTKTFTSTAAGQYLLFCVGYDNGSGLAPNYGSGTLDIWGNDNTPLTVKVGITDGNRNFTELMANNPASTSYQSFNTSGTDFSSKFNGSVSMSAQVDGTNNRFNARITFNGMSPKNLSEGDFLCIYIHGAKGQTAYVYGSSYVQIPNGNFKTSIDGSVLSSTGGNAKNSINDGACASNILSVGASVSRTTWPRNGTIYQYTSDYTIGQIAPFSSYGTSFQGTQLPLIVGPGANIMSSYSTPYINANPAAKSSMGGNWTSDNRENYWGAMQGTSMSCPFVTGTIGLWLQADPTLTYDRVIDILQNSAVTNANTQLASERWGYGLIDGEKGMRYVLATRADIGQVWADDDQRLILSRSEGQIDVFVAGETALSVSITDIQGRTVARAEASGDRVAVSTTGLAPGVYIVKAGGNTATYTRKLTL